jgi:carboxyl-terminal processing protease
MVKREKWILSIILALLLGLSIGLEVKGSKGEEIYDELRILHEALAKLRENHLEINKVPLKELIYGAIEGMIKKLGDPHTRFMPPDTYREMRVETKGAFGGLGIVITIRDEKLIIIAPIESTPAYRAGIKPRDWITHIEGEPTAELSLSEAVKRLRGKPKTKVRITIRREGEEEPLEFELVREIIRIKSVRYGVIRDDIGYLRIITFNQNTIDELDEALKSQEIAQTKSLILDLRNNPGGLLDVAVPVANRFISEGLIVYTKGRSGQEIRFKATKDGTFPDCPLVVLINRGSASASEIVAGAIQDSKRGIILGTKSFGKGSVQTVLPLEDGSGLAITTAKYYTPSGRSIHEVGIEPDIVVEGIHLSKEEIEDLGRLRKEGLVKEFVKDYPSYDDEDLERFMEEIRSKGIELSKAFIKREIKNEISRMEGRMGPLYFLETDPQLQRAVDLLVASEIFREREQ